MLNNIQNDNNITDIITSNSGIERISGYGASNPIENDKNFFIDQSDISLTAFEKYQKEEDIKKFSEILLQTDEQEATNKVIKDIFEGHYSIENDDFLNELLNNEDFLNDIIG